MPPKMKFADGEKVLCFHGPLIYEAKALKSQVTKDKQVKYFIHYAGWNKNWDEWVPEQRVLKYNETNVQRQKEVSKQHANFAGKTKKAKSKKGETSSATGQPTTGPASSATTGASGATGTKDKDSDSRASTPSKELTKDQTAASTVSSSQTPAGAINSSSTTASTGGGGVAVATSKEAAEVSDGKTTSASATATSGGSTASNVTQQPGTNSGSTSSTSSSSSSRRSTNKSEKQNASDVQQEQPRKKRGRLDPTIETEEQFMSKVEVKIKIPDELKPWLVDDWDAITRQHKLVDLPTKTTVQDIIDNYVQFKKASKTMPAQKEPQILEVANGLVEYFNVTLGSQLLYKFERPQYAELLEKYPERPMSTIYGAVHLLRLFIKLGSMLAFTALDDKTIQLLLVHIHDFLKYLVKNSSMLFSMNHFVSSTPEYHRKSQ